MMWIRYRATSPRAVALLLPRLLLALGVLVALVLTCAPAQAGHEVQRQPERWVALGQTAFRHHQTPELTGGTVFAQDNNGFLWMGTQSGLVRWDGYRPRHYAADPTRPGALPDNFVLSLHIDPAGVIWVGTAAGGLARYDPQSDSFIPYSSGPDGVGDRRVTALASDGRGGLWIGTASGLVRMDAQGRFSHPTSPGLPQGEVGSLLRGRGGELWIGSANGLARQGSGEFQPQPIALPGGDGKAMAVNTLYQDSAGRVWIGTHSNGAFVIEPGNPAAHAVHESGATSTLDHERVAAFTEAGHDEIWLATEGASGGIVAINPERGTTRRIRHKADVPDSPFDNDIYAMFRDRSGIVFLASMLALSQHDPQQNAVTTVRGTSADAAGGLTTPGVLVHPNGLVWLAVAGGGVHIVNPESGLVATIAPGVEDGSGVLPQGRVLSIVAAPDGSVYLGTRLGLFHSNADGKQVRRVAIPTRAPDLPIFAMTFSRGVLWVGGLDGLWGLQRGTDGALTLLRHEGASLGDPAIKSLYPTPNGDLWVGTRTGLARLDGASGKVEVMPTDATDITRMAPGYLSSILMDRRGRMWFSSFGAGILLLERTDAGGRRWFRRIGKAQGLRDSGVNKLLEDDAGVIWASTDSGLARIDPVTFQARLLGPAEGVHVSTYWTNAGARGPQGELLFGGLSGLTVLRPAQLSQWRFAAPVAVTKLVLNDREMAASRLNGGSPGTIEIPPEMSDRGFSLEFAALDYSAPERNLYSYRLVGFDSAWIYTDAAARRISYNNLGPGSYSLELRGSNRDGVWSVPLAIPVKVLPAWHQKTWVRVIAALIVLGMLGALMQARTAYLRRRQRELQHMVDERTTELRATQAQLEHLAYADPLTDLPNRRMFNDELRHLAASSVRGAGAFTLLLIDLDHFKQINDTLGHDAGDALLIAAGARLKTSVREVDRLFRLGGDEFAVLLHQTTDVALIDQICARIVAGMALPIPYGEVDMRVSASVGAAPFGTHVLGVEELYKTADAALYRSKARGRNTWTLHVHPAGLTCAV